MLPAPDPDPRARRSPVRIALFRFYLHTLLWRRFSSVRLSRTGVPARHEGRPLVIFTNHPSWWDPAMIALVSPKLFPGRIGFGPMDSTELERYGLFRRMGVFGVEPTPRGAGVFLRTCRSLLADPRTILWVTAEGRFTDPRLRPIAIRPGIAHLARRLPEPVFLPAALEYSFWNESHPEALIRFGTPVSLPPGATIDAWKAALESALERTCDALAAESAQRDAALFTPLLRGTAGVGGAYDLWRRLRAASAGRRFEARHEPGNI